MVRVPMLEQAAQMQQLAHSIQAHASSYLARRGVVFELRWYGVLAHLYRHGPSAVTELSGAIGVTHPAVHQTARSLIREGLVGAYRDARDKRRRVLALTHAGRARLVELRPYFDALEVEARRLFRVQIQALGERSGSVIRIIDFSPQLAPRFAELNREWIEQFFWMEATDETVLGDPQGYIIDQGGAIVFAERLDDNQIIGTCALQIHGRQLGELAKMAVMPSAQGLGAGRALGEAVIERARAKGIRRLYLDTNSILKPAIGLYKQLGFVQLERDDESRYARSDTYMELLLDSEAG